MFSSKLLFNRALFCRLFFSIYIFSLIMVDTFLKVRIFLIYGHGLKRTTFGRTAVLLNGLIDVNFLSKWKQYELVSCTNGDIRFRKIQLLWCLFFSLQNTWSQNLNWLMIIAKCGYLFCHLLVFGLLWFLVEFYSM